MTWQNQIRRFACHEIWNLGLIAQSAEDIALNGITVPVRWLPRPPTWTFLADPFVLNGTLYAEQMDYLRGTGEIWAGVIDPAAAEWCRLQPLLAADVHMSFPFPFTLGGRVHLLCETWEAGGASLYGREGGAWRLRAQVRPEGNAVLDAVLHHDGARWWMFCSLPGPRSNDDLYLYYSADPGGPWNPHPMNPVVSDRTGARSAGPLFTTSLGLMRPAQDCSRTYGGALALNRVQELTPTAYREERIRRLDPVAPYRAGLHTLCPAGDFCIIDGKSWGLHPLDPARKILSAVKTRRRRACFPT